MTLSLLPVDSVYASPMLRTTWVIASLLALVPGGCCAVAVPVASTSSYVVKSVTFSESFALHASDANKPTTLCHGEGLDRAVATLDDEGFWNLHHYYKGRGVLDGGKCTIYIEAINAEPRSVTIENYPEPTVCAIFKEMHDRGLINTACAVCKLGSGVPLASQPRDDVNAEDQPIVAQCGGWGVF